MEMNKYEYKLLEENKDYRGAYTYCSLEMFGPLTITEVLLW
jgi:hypothetical protein